MSDSVAQPARDPAAPALGPDGAKMSRGVGLRSARLWLGLGLSAASVYLVVRGITWAEVSSTLLHVRWWPVLLAWLVVIVTLASKAERWRLLFWPQHRQVGWLRLFGIMLAGQLVNFAFPGRVGDLGRIYFVGQGGGVRRAVVATSIAVEKTVDLIMTLALLALLLPVMAVPGWLRDSALGLTVVTLLLLLTLAGLTWWGGGALPWLSLPLRILPERVQRPLADQLALALTGLRALRQARILAGVVVLVRGRLGHVGPDELPGVHGPRPGLGLEGGTLPVTRADAGHGHPFLSREDRSLSLSCSARPGAVCRRETGRPQRLADPVRDCLQPGRRCWERFSSPGSGRAWS